MRKLNIIPTPRKIKYSEESRDFIPTGACVNGEYKDGLIHALALLGKDIPLTKSGNIKIYIGEQSFTEELRSKTADLFTKKHADKQGYYLKRVGACIVICAMTEIGAIYGIMTLLQICEGDEVPLEIEIFDYPDFLYRGNKWLSWAECGIWSYDRGDGIQKYKERIIKKLDLCLKYKINTVIFEAFGWASERFPGYNELMRS